jgi:uncharacterized membrane protein YoaK (UPF0700 family)
MTRARLLTLSALMSFNGGFVDVACFFGLKGLLAAHITGNLATLCASIVLGAGGLVSKIAAVPEFMLIAACTHGVGRMFKAWGWPGARILLGAEVILLALFLLLAVRFGPFDDTDSFAALMTALAAIAAMAVQNGVQRAHMPHLPPTTFMTGNATQASLDAIDLILGDPAGAAADPLRKSRFAHIALNLACFAVGCAVAALTFAIFGFWCVALTVPAAVLATVLMR